jgi:hypothetical protein
MPCYRCGARQVDPDRGASPWKRGVVRDRQVLLCPICQAEHAPGTELDRCGSCVSTHLVARLGEVECRDCGWVKPALPAQLPPPARSAVSSEGLAEEVARALGRVLGRPVTHTG